MGKQYLINEDTLKGIGNAIRRKTGSTEDILAKNFETQIDSIKTGIEINGLIEQYKVMAGSTINAGDFVNFVNIVLEEFTDRVGTRHNCISCVVLDENKVFFAQISENVTITTSLLEIIDGDINVLANENTTYTTNYGLSSSVLLEPNKVFLAYGDASNNLCGLIISINNNTMTYYTSEICSNGIVAASTTGDSCVLIEQNRVFIARSASNYLYGTLVDISGNIMEATTTQLNSTSNSCNKPPRCVALGNNKVFIAHSYGTNYYVYGTIVEINGATMTPTAKALNSNYYAANKGYDCILLEDNKVLIVHGNGFNNQLTGTIVTIDEINMTSTPTVLNTTNNSYLSDPSCVLLEPNKVLILHHYVASGTVYGAMVTINGTTMTANVEFIINDTNLFASYHMGSLFVNGVVLTSHGSSVKNSYFSSYLLKSKAIPTTDVIKGIANTSGTSGETIEVYVPKGEE